MFREHVQVFLDESRKSTMENQKETICEDSSWLAEAVSVLNHEIEDAPRNIIII